jgi:hypothetical protein
MDVLYSMHPKKMNAKVVYIMCPMWTIVLSIL